MRILKWLIVAVVAGCAGPRTLTILHTNDIHGRFMPERASWRADSALVGGFAALSGALDSVRRSDSHTLYLDAGDVMTGNPICNVEVNSVQGGALLELLRLCECDAGCLGNHEFDLGAEQVRAFAATKQVDILCANLTENDGRPLCPPYKLIERGGVRVGVIGLLLTDLAGVTSKQAIEPFEVADIAERAQLLIDELDPQSELIILLTHNGLENDIELARHVRGCDIIVGGHSHTRLTAPVEENGVLIVQAGSYLKNLGVLRVDVARDRITNYTGSLVELECARFVPDGTVASYAGGFAEQITREYSEIIAVAGMNMERRYQASSPLGNLICDLLRAQYGTDFAVTNSGGLRKDIPAGPVSKLDCQELMPFVNSVSLFHASGAELAAFALRQAEAQHSDRSEILQMSGLTISYAMVNDRPVEIEILVGGKRVDPDSTYSGVSIDYVLISQAEKYLGFTPSNVEGTGLLFSEFIARAFAAAPQPLMAIDEPRLTRRNP